MADPAALQTADMQDLQRVVEDFPSSGILQSLYLKMLKNEDNYLYPKQLKRAAIAAPDRKILHTWVEAEVVVLVEETKPQISFNAPEALENAKRAAAKLAAEQKEKAEKLQRELAAKKAAESQVSEVAAAPQPAVQPVVAEQKPISATPVKEDDLDLSNLPASVRETVLRARKIRSQITGEKQKETHVVVAPPAVVPVQATEPPVKLPIVEKEPVVEPEVVSEKVPETPLVKAPEPMGQEESTQEVEETVSPVAEKALEDVLETVPEVIQEPISSVKEVLPEGMSFTLTDEEPILEKPEETLSPSVSGKHSFSAWLQGNTLSQPQKTTEEEAPELDEEVSFSISEDEVIEPTPKTAQAQDLLASFMEKPRIKFIPPGQDKNIEMAELTTSAHSDYITETLAQVYVQQKLYNRAINAYEILRLKYPEKSSFFAAQISEVKNLQKEKE